MDNLILFDGKCNLCNSSVQFIIERDPDAVFTFASLQSDIGQEMLNRFDIPTDIDSIILIQDNQYYAKSSAALLILKKLSGAWQLLSYLMLVPKPVRDFFYEIVARNRYKWFGKRDSCMLPSPELKRRFLD